MADVAPSYKFPKMYNSFLNQQRINISVSFLCKDYIIC